MDKSYMQAIRDWSLRRGQSLARNIIVVSKPMFGEVYEMLKDSDDIAFISIEATEDAAKLHCFDDNGHYAPSSDKVLNLDFDDVEKDEEFEDGLTVRAITEEQASSIVDFVNDNIGCHLIVHCRAGQSRSQGVAYALMCEYPVIYAADDINRFNPCIFLNYEVSGNLCAEIRKRRVEELKIQFV